MSQDSAAHLSTQTSSAVLPAAEAFLAGLIDYAGLFPPTRLPFEEAITNYAGYRRSEDAWMLGPYICPAGRLAELVPYTDLFPPDDPTPVSMLATGGAGRQEFAAALEEDLRAGTESIEHHEGRLRIDLLEARLPEDVFSSEDGSGLDQLLVGLGEALSQSSLAIRHAYMEVSLSGDWRRHLDMAARAIADHGSDPLPLGLKFRCGGITPDAFPPPEKVARAIAVARDAGVPFKATAGLHHPLRHHDPTLEVVRHGFLNVFGAAVLAHALDLSEAAIRQIIRGEQIHDFRFDDEGFSFQDLRITAEQVRAARESFAHSFGSCSFDEPRDDLRAEGLL